MHSSVAILLAIFCVIYPIFYQVDSAISNAVGGKVINPLNSEPDTKEWIDDEIHGYHFHTYFFQNNAADSNEALTFREAIQARIDSGLLANCRLNRFNTGPIGPHPIGSYETCCNKTSISPAISFFMQNRGNLSILLHALTRYEVEDHTSRSMFLGQRLPLDVTALRDDLEDNLDLCLPINNTSDANGRKPEITIMAFVLLFCIHFLIAI